MKTLACRAAQAAPAIALLVALGGCGATKGLPLVFGQAHSVGITITGSAPEQSAELTFGYKDKDIAVVPLDALSTTTVGESGTDGSSKNVTVNDSLSVLGLFDVDSKSNAKDVSANVSLGKFFSTGTAASKLAEGFKCKLGGSAGSIPDGCIAGTTAAPAPVPPQGPVAHQ